MVELDEDSDSDELLESVDTDISFFLVLFSTFLFVGFDFFLDFVFLFLFLALDFLFNFSTKELDDEEDSDSSALLAPKSSESRFR